MKIVIAGPFGAGTLADEAVLAGLLGHLGKKHEITVLSQDPLKTEALHGVEAEKLAKPKDLLSTPAAWRALTQAHLLVVCGGGVLSERGAIPACAWLSLLEHARRVEVKTAAVGLGALEIADPRERIRLQRLLHNFADCVSARDEASKRALVSYGLSPNRISANGDLALALGAQASSLPADARASSPPPDAARIAAPEGRLEACAPRSRRLGIIFSEHVPSREGFGVEERKTSISLFHAAQSWLRALLAALPHELVIFHDDTASAADAAAAICNGTPSARLRTRPANCALLTLQKELAACEAIFSFTLHGLILGAASGRPVAGLAAETGASQFLTSLGLASSVVACQNEDFAAEAAVSVLRDLIARAPEISALVQQKFTALARKEAHDARMLEYLVPKRERYPPRPPRKKKNAE